MRVEKKNSPLARWLALGALALASVPLALAWQADRAQNAEPLTVRGISVDLSEWIRPNEIAVQLRPGVAPGVLTELGAKTGLAMAWNSPISAEEGVARLSLPSGISAESALAKLQADPRVEAADVVHIYRIPENEAQVTVEPGGGSEEETGRWKPNDPRYNEQWNFRMIKAEEAWEISRGKNVVVAVIDTGVAFGDTRKGKIGRDFKETKFVKGYDFVNRDDMPNDDHGHGTHVAGTIAESTNNSEGVAGLAFEAKIMPVKVLSAAGGGTSADIAEAIRWSADHGANVINMSLGGPFPDKLMRSACEYAKKKGVTIVCAAGNSGREGVGYPAAYKDCIAVSAVGPKGDLSFYSTWGKEIAIAAPGGDKMVDEKNGGILQNTVYDVNGDGVLEDDYYQFQGTSMASPHAAAVAALIVAKGVKDPDDVKAVMQKSAMKKGPANKYGAGITDAANAAKTAANVYGDGVARFWMVLGLYAGCWGVGRLRRRGSNRSGAPFWATTALAFGLLFPDWLTGYLGMTSMVNLVGHSILIPGTLLIMGANSGTERRLLGWMAFGLTIHLGWEFLRGTAPFAPGLSGWQMIPWVASNVAIGMGMALSGLTAKKD